MNKQFDGLLTEEQDIKNSLGFTQTTSHLQVSPQSRGYRVEVYYDLMIDRMAPIWHNAFHC